jgi:hypothetical protein
MKLPITAPTPPPMAPSTNSPGPEVPLDAPSNMHTIAPIVTHAFSIFPIFWLLSFYKVQSSNFLKVQTNRSLIFSTQKMTVVCAKMDIFSDWKLKTINWEMFCHDQMPPYGSRIFTASGESFKLND